MKTLFIPARLKFDIDIEKIKSISKKLPEKIAIAYSIQYENIAQQIKEVIPDKITSIIQILGCSNPKFPNNTKAILLISDGNFHAISLAQQTKLPVYLLTNYKLTKISKKDIEDFQKKQKAGYVKFLNADKIGIIVSVKSGQQNLKRAFELRKKLKNKSSYLFICNNINTNEFENFGLDSWINTACPRMDMNSHSFNLINYQNLKKEQFHVGYFHFSR